MAFNQDSIAAQIKDSVAALLLARKEISNEIDREGHDEDKILGKGTFSDADEEWGAGGRTGLVASMQGIRTVFNALAALDRHPVDIWDAVSPDSNEPEPPIHDLLDEWASCLDQLDEDGYHADPYDLGNELSQMFRLEDHEPCYVDTVAWALSTSVLVNYIIKTKGGALLNRTTESGLLDRTRKRLLASLQVLLDAQTEDGGWGWWPKSSTGHLIFTWSAVGGISDLYDFVLGESEKETDIGPDIEMRDYLHESDSGILARLQESRQKASDFLSRKYLKIATTPQGLQASDVSENDIVVAPKNPLTLVFCELYLLEALILVDYHERHEDQSGSREDELELLFTQIVGKLPRIKDPAFALNTDATTLQFNVRSSQKYKGEQVVFTAMDGGLWPQLLRTLVLYRFYVKKDPLSDPNIVGEKGSALRLLLDARRPPEVHNPGLWDTESFNLAITARAIDGLVDSFDYFDLQRKLHHPESPHSHPVLVQDGLATAIADAVYPLIEQRIQTSLQVGELSGTLASVASRVSAEFLGDSATASPVQPAAEQPDLHMSVAHLMDIVADATSHDWLPGCQQLDPDAVVRILLGSKAELMRADDNVYQLFSRLAWLSFNVGVRLWSTILQEVVVERVPREEQDDFRAKIGKDGPGSLAERLKQVMMVLADAEQQAADGIDEDRPSYRKIAQSLLCATKPPASPAGRSGKKG
jgi:hypothetical protein